MSFGEIKGQRITVHQNITVNNYPNTNEYISYGKAKFLNSILEEVIKLDSVVENRDIEISRRNWRYKIKVNFGEGHYLNIHNKSYEAVKRYILSQKEILENRLREKIFEEVKFLLTEDLIEIYKLVKERSI